MAEAYNNAKSIEEVIKCNHCHNIIEKPVTLPCIHHFCKTCLPEINSANTNGVHCPICKQFAPSKYIKKNSAMEQLVEMHINKITLCRTVTICDMCMKQNSSHQCLECKIEICHDCYIGHLRIPSCKGHTVKEYGVDEKQSQNVINTIVFCPEHQDKIIEFSCVECNKAICYKCKILKHDKHNTSTIEDATKKQKEKTQQKISPITGDIPYLTAKTERLEKLETYTKEIEEKFIHEIERKRTELVAKVNKDAAALTKEIKTQFQAKLKEISKDKMEKMNQLSSRESATTWAYTVLNHFQDVNLLLQLQGDLMESLDQYKHKLSDRYEKEVSPLNLGLLIKRHSENIIGEVKIDPKTYGKYGISSDCDAFNPQFEHPFQDAANSKDREKKQRSTTQRSTTLTSRTRKSTNQTWMYNLGTSSDSYYD